ncbi:MAG: helix-turn-helix transcriptional regulator [Bacteroidales bacterium]|nr:helix-turn-helix transcriptional regulator [Bacteroidales bacterium]
MKIQKSFGLIIKELRNNAGISQERLALESGVDRTYIGDIEKGNRNVSLEIIEKLCRYFKIPISELFIKIEKHGKTE